MKKFVRFAGVALLALTVGVVGCDDDVVPVAPVAPPPPPPLVVTMSPASAEVAEGSNVVFAVNASGGAAGETASWTCASSDTAIATASVTSAGCQATGVAAGGVTITATVTKGSESGNVGSQLSVMGPQVGDPALIILASIEWGEDGSTEATGLKGRVDVQANVERGDQTLEAVMLLVDGDVVASTNFGVAATPAPDEPAPAAQAIHSFTLSFDSDDYDSSTGSPAYMNGDHVISMQLKVAGSEPISSNGLAVDFNNDDGVYVTVSGLGSGALNSGTGQRWYGGPAAAVEITAVPVMYSGGAAASVGIGEFCGDEDGATATAAPFVLTPECEGTGEHTAMFTADGADIGVLNSDVFPLYLDYDGPSAPIFSPNPNNREDGWANATVDFLGEQGATNKDGWLTYNDDDDAGVGGYQPVLRYAEEDGASVEDAIAASPLTLATLPGESDEDAYCAVVSAVDHLGNESDLPDEDAGKCLAAGVAATYRTDGMMVDVAATANSYELLLQVLYLANAMEPVNDDDVAAAEAALADAGLLVGVDITPPGIELEDDIRINAGNPSFDFDIYDDENANSNSGLHTLPLLVTVQIRDTDDTDCLDIGDAGAVGTTSADCDDPTPLTDIAVGFESPANAYYTLGATALDKAGNRSAPLSHTFVFDGEVATATPLAAPGNIEAGEVFQVASFLNDDLSIRDYYVTANFAGEIELGVVPPTVVDAFDADPLTYRNQTVAVDVETYAGVTTEPGVNAAAATGVTVAVRDQGQLPYTEVSTPEGFSVGDPATDDGFTENFSAVLSDIDAVCVADDEGDCLEANRKSKTELEFVATANAIGSFSDPFDRVDFWVQDVNGASWMLGSDTSGESGRKSATDRTRTWTYSLDATAAALYMRTREAGFPPASNSDMHTVRAFGVNDDGVALTATKMVTIDDGETDQ